MSSLFDRIGKIARSPQSRRMVEQAKRVAQDPKNKAKAQQLVNKLRKRH
jgi:hypothetical protein